MRISYYVLQLVLHYFDQRCCSEALAVVKNLRIGIYKHLYLALGVLVQHRELSCMQPLDLLLNLLDDTPTGDVRYHDGAVFAATTVWIMSE
jgi:hypothetical protein